MKGASSGLPAGESKSSGNSSAMEATEGALADAMMSGAGRSYWQLVWLQFRKRKTSLVALAAVLLLFAIALGAPFIASDEPLLLHWRQHTYVFPDLVHYRALRFQDNSSLRESMGAADWAIFPPIDHGPYENDLIARLKPPSAEHWLGTDETGRDVAARMVWGARVSLSVGFVAVGIYLLIGVFLGALAGYYRGFIDSLISRGIEVMLVFPTFFLILTIMGIVEHTGIFAIMGVIGLTGWTQVARLIRGEILRIRELDYVQAERALGASDRRILWRHVIPNAIGPVLVAATFGVADAILIESGLSFLGFGTPPPTASWGELLTQANRYVSDPGAWWLTLFPGLAIFLTITVYNLVGEGFRDAIDPRLK